MASKTETTMKEDELLEKVVSGEMPLRKIDAYTDTDTAVRVRKCAIEKMKGIKFEHIQNYTIDAEAATKRNIENMIGTIQIPLGVADAIKVNGEYANGDFTLPLATTEGALVASVNRGCTVITASGGSNVRIFQDLMTRAPVFKLENVNKVKDFVDWVKEPETFTNMKEKAGETTRFGELLSVDPFITGNTVFLRFAYDTKDAMGMNMVTIATDAVLNFISEEFGVYPISLSGNMCTDKKPAAINNILGRGKTVAADVTIPKEIVEKKLKTTPKMMEEVNYRKNLLGSARAGALGFNAHAANIIAALYLACGQDAAHVVEGSSAITTMEVNENGDLYCAVTLPSIQVGTVGGGTGIATQRDCLNLLGVAGAGEVPGHNSKKLAEIIAAAVLAGEISLIGAQAAGHLAKAHAELGR
ncbi:MAG: hydroxymethylglutaryl-CoA reductase (NADPH) [Methanococcoides sp.]|nr:hydroxymethylglutaryl-CoA reductase (NADPH) [Methanococcoides sp.]